MHRKGDDLQGCSERGMLAGSEEESSTSAWVKVKKHVRLLLPRPEELLPLAKPARTRVCFTAVKTHELSLEILVHLQDAGQSLPSERDSNISQYQGLSCWVTGFWCFVCLFGWGFFAFLWII